MEDRQHTTKECADKLIPEIICFRKKFDQVMTKNGRRIFSKNRF